MQTDYALSAWRADRVLGLSRLARQYRPRSRDDGPIIDAIQKHLEVDPRHGFGLLFGQALKSAGFGKTRSWRVYYILRLNLPRRAIQIGISCVFFCCPATKSGANDKVWASTTRLTAATCLVEIDVGFHKAT